MRRTELCLSLESVRAFNTAIFTGQLPLNNQSLEDAVLDYVSLSRTFDSLAGDEEALVRMIAEGYRRKEICEALGISFKSYARLRNGLRVSFILAAH